MRPLAYAAFLLSLAGCSMPYEGTSFKAMPKAEATNEGEKQASNDEARFNPVGGDQMRGRTERRNGTDTEARSAIDRTAAVFPTTAQPGG